MDPRELFGLDAALPIVRAEAVDGRLVCPVPDASADAVVAEGVFHRVEDVDAALEEVRRALKPLGLLCFREPSPSFLRMFIDLVSRRSVSPHYFRFLGDQPRFHGALDRRFGRFWLRHGWLIQYGKYAKRS